MLGERELRKWLLLVSAIMAGNRKPELVTTALVRARFAELIGPSLEVSGPLGFLLGLLSLLHAILDLPMAEVAEQLAVPTGIRGALMGSPGNLRYCLELVVAYETGDWGLCEELVRERRVRMDVLVTKYCEAVQWAETLMKSC